MELRRRRLCIWVTGCFAVTSFATFDLVAPSAAAAASTAATVSCTPVPAGAIANAEPLAGFTAQDPPQRLVDTRSGIGGVTGLVGAGCTLRIEASLTGAPATAEALALSVTAIATERGFVTIHPCASGRPPTSNVNARPLGTPTPNLSIALLDVDRAVCIYTERPAHLIVDMTGWWTGEGQTRFRSIPPVRADDSRTDPGSTPVPANTTRVIDLSDVVPPGTRAVVANLTVAQPAANGYLAAFPCGTTPPSSNLNFRQGESRAVAITVGISADRTLCTLSDTAHHVVVDVGGYYEPTPQFGPSAALTPVAGTRLADSRGTDGPWTSSFGAGTVRSLQPVAGRADAASATAVVINTVATNADGPGYVTIYPCDDEVPLTSVVNFDAREEATNLTFVDLSANAEICFFTSAGVDLVVDLFGVMTAPTGALAERIAFDSYTWPPFSPSGTDYAVECGASPIELELDLLPGTSARVNNVPVEPGTVELPGDDDRLTTVTLRRGGETQSYWFRCVPAGFPRFVVERPGAPEPGWYLTSGDTPGGSFAIILDEYGAPVWYKRFDVPSLDLKLRSDGRLVYTPNLGPRYGIDPDAGYRAMSLYGTLVGEYIAFDTDGLEHPTDHHDFAEIPGGGYALISYPVVDGVDLTALPGDGWLANDSIADNVVQEFDAAGELVWSWALSEHFGYDEVPYPVRWPGSPEYAAGEVDVFHTNGLAAIADGTGDYLVTARHLDAAFRIDRATDDIDWILSSLPTDAPQLTGAPRLQIVNDPLGGPRRPHHAQLVGDVLTVLDNRADTGQPSRAVAYRIDDVAETATLLWSITASGNGPVLGSVDVDPAGSIVVDWGSQQPLIQEFDADRELLMQIRQDPNGAIYRVIKEPKSTWSAGQLRLAAGGTVEAP